MRCAASSATSPKATRRSARRPRRALRRSAALRPVSTAPIDTHNASQTPPMSCPRAAGARATRCEAFCGPARDARDRSITRTGRRSSVQQQDSGAGCAAERLHPRWSQGYAARRLRRNGVGAARPPGSSPSRRCQGRRRRPTSRLADDMKLRRRLRRRRTLPRNFAASSAPCSPRQGHRFRGSLRSALTACPQAPSRG
ncbi:MAG: hypothetical protein QOG56_247 [Solirubrobacteraceae bacterium]|nr:hypothetical protein [Solirubrobacteraceae bacterium]